MSNVCIKWKCPNRFAIGTTDDEDVLNIVCPNCEKMFYHSETRTKRFRIKLKYLSIFLLVFSVLIVGWVHKEDIFASSIELGNYDDGANESNAKNVILNFFKYINNREYYNAYKLTQHAKWKDLNTFSKNVKNWNNMKLLEMEGKDYFSRYDADTIVHVVYKGAEDITGKVELRDYDYHLKLVNGQYKIVRIYFPMDPESDVLKKKEIPSSSTDAVRSFLRFLNERKYKKAHRLTDNSTWGNQAKFISTNSFGCISRVSIYKVQKAKNLSPRNEVVFASYYLEDSCNGSKEYNLYFEVSNKLDYWRIIGVSNRLNEFN